MKPCPRCQTPTDPRELEDDNICDECREEEAARGQWPYVAATHEPKVAVEQTPNGRNKNV